MDNWESTEVVFEMSFSVYGSSSSYSSNSIGMNTSSYFMQGSWCTTLFTTKEKKGWNLSRKHSETKIYSTLVKSITYILQLSAFTYISHNPITSNQNWYHFVVRNIAHSILFRSALQIFSMFSLLSRSNRMV